MLSMIAFQKSRSAAHVGGGIQLKLQDVASAPRIIAVAALVGSAMTLPASAEDAPARACSVEAANHPTAAASAPRPADTAHGSHDDQRSKTITVADLDLSTQEGLRIARERIHQVARNLCTQLASPLDLSHQSNFVACVESAMDRASRQLAGPALAVARSTAASVDQPL